MLEIEKAAEAVDIKVLVQFAQKGGTVYQGEFTGEFRRITQERIDELLDPDGDYTVSDVVDEVLVGARGIGKGGTEMPPDEALAWVKQQPECISAAYAAFFKAMRPERYNEKTSRRARKRG
jgi:hypothetical protein